MVVSVCLWNRVDVLGYEGSRRPGPETCKGSTLDVHVREESDVTQSGMCRDPRPGLECEVGLECSKIDPQNQKTC